MKTVISTISDSTFKNLELSADLGDLKINDTILTDSQIEMMDGDVKAENISFSGENEFTSDLGDITLSIPKKLSCRTFHRGRSK